jgi:hypothetical protein
VPLQRQTLYHDGQKIGKGRVSDEVAYIYQTFRWVIGLLASRKFADVKDGNNQKLRMHVFVDNINDSLLKTAFSALSRRG